MTETHLITVKVGSHAHGLATETSDVDLRGVYAVRTRDLLFVGKKPRETKWVEGATEDDVSWELKRFLTMAIHCDPNVIEIFVAPVTHNSPWSHTLRKLLPAVISKSKVAAAFRGYATNRLRRLLEFNLPEIQRRKGALAAIRTLMHAGDLLKYGDYSTKMEGTRLRILERMRDDQIDPGNTLHLANQLNDEIEAALENSPVAEEPDLERVNMFIESIREACW